MAHLRLAPLLVVALALASPLPVAADPAGRTTAEERIRLDGGSGLRQPVEAPGRKHVIRTPVPGLELPAPAGAQRSLAFFAHLTDAQLADEMSPARLEYRRGVSGSYSVWRPHEALGPQTFDQAVRNVNLNAVSRTTDAGGARATLDFALVTGDLSDNHQRNEVRWGVRILEGGTVDPFSGRRIGPRNRCPGAPRSVRRRLNRAVAARRYTGVQDRGDLRGRAGRSFWDPDEAPPAGVPGRLPSHPGLMDRAQRPFVAEGLAVPWYAARGNHDGLAQGFFGALPGAGVAIGCRKATGFRAPLGSGRLGSPWNEMRSRLQVRRRFAWVPPDPARRFVTARGFKRLHGGADRRHGFALTPRAESRRSRRTASYYSWSPGPGLRFISIDTVADGGGSDGNLDHPQYRWLSRALRGARRRGELVVVYGHHSLETMANRRRDERAGRCGTGAVSCDGDPRRSAPLHLGLRGSTSLRTLLLRHPNVILYVTGHMHSNRVIPWFKSGGRSGFWQVTTASHMSYPQQTRLVELMDYGNGTLSIVNTVLDTAAPIQPPAPGTPAAGLTEGQLGSLSRMLSANVRERAVTATAAAASPYPSGNVELLVPDPRR